MYALFGRVRWSTKHPHGQVARGHLLAHRKHGQREGQCVQPRSNDAVQSSNESQIWLREGTCKIRYGRGRLLQQAQQEPLGTPLILSTCPPRSWNRHRLGVRGVRSRASNNKSDPIQVGFFVNGFCLTVPAQSNAQDVHFAGVFAITRNVEGCLCGAESLVCAPIVPSPA